MSSRELRVVLEWLGLVAPDRSRREPVAVPRWAPWVVAFLLVGAAALAHFFVLRDVDVVLAGKLLIGSIPGVLIGSRLTVWVPRRPLQAGLAVLLLTTAVSLLR